MRLLLFSSAYSQFTGKLRSDKLETLKKNLSSQQFVFKRKKAENEAATRASFRTVHLLAKHGKPFTDGDLVKSCMIEAAQEMCPEKVDLFKTISLSANTVARRVEDIGSNLMSQLKSKSKEFEYFSIALDESTDINDTSQLLIFIRGVDSNFEITEELLSVSSMHRTTTGEDIFKEVHKSLTQHGLDWKGLKCVTTDGGRNMCGTGKGLIEQINRSCGMFEAHGYPLHYSPASPLCQKSKFVQCYGSSCFYSKLHSVSWTETQKIP